MGTPCRSGSDCAVINTQRNIRKFTEQARKAATEARDAVRMTWATAVAREAANRVLNELLKSQPQVVSALAAKGNAEAALQVANSLMGEGAADLSLDVELRHSKRNGVTSYVASMSLAAMRAADEATAAGIAATAARAAARSHEGADASDIERARDSREIRLIARMAREAEDALAIAEEDER